MKLIRYGITLHRLKEDDLELVRQWRNDPVVRDNFAFRDYITPVMQHAWFKSINNIHNFYTVIEYQAVKIGVINLKNIDWDEMSAEGGIFIPDVKYHQTSVPATISFMTTEILLNAFHFKTGYAHVLKENDAVRSFIYSLGYKMCPGQENEANQKFFITPDLFRLRTSGRFREAIGLVAGTDEPGFFIFEPNEAHDPVALEWEEKIQHHLKPMSDKVNIPGRVYLF
ncbi:MAG: GNAT family N-acetyltransferase [Bacteroidota bacterium]